MVSLSCRLRNRLEIAAPACHVSVMESTALFMSKDLQAALRRHREGVSEMVNGIRASQFVIMDRQKLTERVVRDAILIPIKLDESMTLVRLHEGMIEILPEPDSRESRTTAKWEMGIQVEIEIPLSGDGWLLKCEPNTTFGTRPIVGLERGCLRLTIGIPDTMDMGDVKKAHNELFALVKNFVGKFNDEIHCYNGQLYDLVAKEVDSRHARLETISEFRKILLSDCKGHESPFCGPCMPCE